MTAASTLDSLLERGSAVVDGSVATEALAVVRRAPLYRPDVSLALAATARAAHSSDSVAYWDITEQLALAAADRGAWAVFDRAVDELRGRFPASWRVDMVLGYLAEARGAWDGALKVYMHVVAGDPLRRPAYRRQVAVLKAQRRGADAIALLNHFLSMFSCDVDAWAELAALCLAEGRMEHALFAANEVLLHSPAGWAAHVAVADVHMTMGGAQHWLSARRHYSASLAARRGGNMRALYGLWMAASALDAAHDGGADGGVEGGGETTRKAGGAGMAAVVARALA
jgi:hypothetical protein